MMFFQFLIAIAAGLAAGCITGLIPGIHVNLLAVLLIACLNFFLKFVDPLSLSFFLISLSITHSFLDSIPSIYLGAPDASQALGVLPGHRYLLRGKGYHAVKLTLLGSLGAALFSTITIPFMIPLVVKIVPFIQQYTVYLLILISIAMVWRDNNKAYALLIYLLSGILGVFVLNSSLENALFPLLSGLFGTSTLLYSLKENTVLPEQRLKNKTTINYKLCASVLAAGALAGWLTATLPGIGAGIAAIGAMLLVPKMGDYGFMILIGSINTYNFTYSLLTLTYLEKARNGAVLAIQEIFVPEPLHLASFLGVVLVAAGSATLLGLFFGKKVLSLMQRIRYDILTSSIVVLIVVLTFVLSGVAGALVLVTSTAIGLVTAATKTTRIQNMSCILLPVILFLL